MQSSLWLGAADDPLEREADETAGRVMKMQPPTSPHGGIGTVPSLRRAPAALSAPGWKAATAPPIVHEVLHSEAQPLDPEARSFFEPRFGCDLSRVRIHSDSRAAESARSIEARAYAVGNQIVFENGHYAPHTDSGRQLLAHEIAHVLQQSPQLRRQPQQHASDQTPSAQGVKPTSIYYSVQIHQVLNAAELAVALIKQYHHFATDEEAKKYIADHKAHWVGGLPTVTEADVKKGYIIVTMTLPDLKLPSRDRQKKDFDQLTEEEKKSINAAANQQFWDMTKYKPGHELGQSSDDKKMGETWKDVRAKLVQDKKVIDALPQAAREILLGDKDATVDPDDYATVARIGNKLLRLTPEELQDYKSKVIKETSDWSVIEDSIDRYLAQRERRQKELEAAEPVKTKLYGLKDTYVLYREYKATHSTMYTIAEGNDESADLQKWAAEAENELIASLKANGFHSIGDFEKMIQSYEKVFEQQTLNIAFDALDKYAHVLFEEEKKYSNAANVTNLHEKVEQSTAKKDYAEAASEASTARAITPDPELHRFLGNDFQRKQQHQHAADAAKASGEAAVKGASGNDALIGEPDFDREALAGSTQAEKRQQILGYIRDRRKDIAETRANLNDEPEMIYGLDKLLELSYKDQAIDPESIFGMIIEDKISSRTWREIIKAIVFTIVGIALAVLTGGTGLVAVLAGASMFGLGAYQAWESFREYEVGSAAHGAKLLSDDPSLAWVIVAVVGAGIDLAGAVSAVRGMEGAVTAFNKTRNITELREALEKAAGISEEVRQSVLRAAVAQIEADESLAKFGAKALSTANSGLGGLNATPELAMVLYNMGKRGYTNFERFMAEMKAAKLIDESKLTAAELLQLKAVFAEARGVVSDVVKAGKELGLSDKEIGSFIKQMSEDRSLSVGQIKNAMADAANSKPISGAADATEVTAKSTKKSRSALDVADRNKAAAKLKSAEERIAEHTASAKAESEAAEAARRELKVLSDPPKSVPDSLKNQMDRILKLKDMDDKIEAIESLQRASKSLTEDEKSFLEWRRQSWSLQKEVQDSLDTAKSLSRKIDDLATVKSVAEQELREASKDVMDVMRSNGPLYRAKSAGNVDEVMSKEAWAAVGTPKPALATDHLVSLDRMSKMSELNELLTLYPEASPAIKAQMKEDLKALGDFEDNLVRMQAKPNSAVKSNKSWHEITYDQVKPYGYRPADVDKMRGLEDTALQAIKDRIAKLTADYRVKIKPQAKP
jgi:hypothetical protein